MNETKVNMHLDGVLNLVDQMVTVADQGILNDSDDNGFYLLYGIIRDNAHTIRKAAEKEYELHDVKVPVKYLTHKVMPD